MGPFRESGSSVEERLNHVEGSVERLRDRVRENESNLTTGAVIGSAAYALMALLLFVDIRCVSGRVGELEKAPPPASGEAEARHRLTLEQDHALCARACGTLVGSVCHWERDGVRDCSCTCGVHGCSQSRVSAREQR